MGGFLSHVLGWRCALVIGAVVAVAAPANAETLTERLLSDSGDGRLDNFDFVAAALIASGVEDECELGGWLDAYVERRDESLDNIPHGPPVERLQAIHAALHGRILTGDYQIEASDLRLALSRGDFNCLSSLAIYFDLCQAAGQATEIWLARGHVYLVSANEHGAAAVIEPGAIWAGQQSSRQLRARHITPVELLGKFYYNRGVQALKNREFAAGLDLLQSSLKLDPADSDARANLVAGLNNWAVERFRAKRYADAVPLIEQGLRLDPAFAPLIANERLVRARLSE